MDDYVLRLHPRDNVGVMRRPVPAGAELVRGSHSLITGAAIPEHHKVALDGIPAGGVVVKYGHVIGFATQAIYPGDHVHSHNLEMRAFDRAADPLADTNPVAARDTGSALTFPGFARPDGRVGTRNYVAILSSVNCSASVSKYVAQRYTADVLRDRFPGVDGVIALTHKGGCCMQPGQPADMLKRVITGFARHPNVFGYILIGLGCEGNQVNQLVSEHRLNVLQPGESEPAFMTIQEVGGTRQTVEHAARAVEVLLEQANDATRTPQPLSKLVLAEQCGGSDANSGITANPAVGVAGDELIRHGGTAVLAETPEVYGAEHLLTARAVNEAVAAKLMNLIRWWEEHAAMHGASIDNNPTPGNKEGGLTTIYEKSLGAVAKAGQAPLSAVYEYAEPITVPGLGFMDSPGYDPVSMTGLVAGGANLGVFTTGRGSVYGCKPAPTIKVASNTPLYERMTDDMDVNAGTILDGDETVQEVGERLFDLLIRVAGGERTRSEAQGLGDEEFAPWQIGPTF